MEFEFNAGLTLMGQADIHHIISRGEHTMYTCVVFFPASFVIVSAHIEG